MKCIDMRARPGPVASFTPEYFARRPEGPEVIRETIPDYIKKMDKNGIDLSVLIGRFNVTDERQDIEHISIPHKTIVNICKEHPDRFRGIAGVDGSWKKKTSKEVEEIASMDGMVGICLETGWMTIPMHINDPRLYPVYDTCGDLDLLVVFTMSSFVGPNISYGVQWKELDQVAYDFKNVKFIVAHGGWPFMYQMIGIGHKHKNVYNMPDVYLHKHRVGSNIYVEAANQFMADQLIFGSTYPLDTLENAVGEAKKLPFVDEERREKYLWKNAAKLLKLKT